MRHYLSQIVNSAEIEKPYTQLIDVGLISLERYLRDQK